MQSPDKPTGRPPRKRCLFCDGLPLSKEHLFADWMRKLAPGQPARFQRKSAISARLALLKAPTFSWKTGNLLSRRLRVVCKPCNETWMGQIEQAAIPVMTPLILGQSAKLSASDQLAIAVWTTLKTIIAEQREPMSAQIPVEWRKEFYRTKTVLPGWQIWIGQYATGTWSARCHHRAAPFTMPRTTSSGILYQDRGQAQATTFIVGKLFIHAFSTTIPFRYPIKPDLVRYLHAILPTVTAEIVWPPSNSLGDSEVEQIMVTLGLTKR